MINLLPKNSKHAGQIKGGWRKIIVLYVLVTVALGAGAIGLLSYSNLLGWQTERGQSELAELKQQRTVNKELVVQAAFIKERLKNEAKYRDSDNWPGLLDLVAAAVPTDVQLTDLKFGKTMGGAVTITLSGETASRRSIILFKDKLSSQSGISSAEITAMNEVKSEAAKKFTFTINAAYSSASQSGKEI